MLCKPVSMPHLAYVIAFCVSIEHSLLYVVRHQVPLLQPAAGCGCALVCQHLAAKLGMPLLYQSILSPQHDHRSCTAATSDLHMADLAAQKVQQQPVDGLWLVLVHLMPGLRDGKSLSVLHRSELMGCSCVVQG